MAWLSTFQTMRIKARLAEKQKALSALDKALSEINEVKEYQLDGGDGTVRTMYRGAGEIRKQISILENEIE
ncbi:MAG: hypothetical protein GY874_18455, partial [Desulfobacteraceae bacterium]|nr:hypothetical protein [Desulfobacteraceae bacterium]